MVRARPGGLRCAVRPGRPLRGPADLRAARRRGGELLGTHRGALEGLTATNRPVVLHVVFFAELREEKLYRVRAFFDAYGAAVALGVLPRAGTLGEKALLMLRGFGLPRRG